MISAESSATEDLAMEWGARPKNLQSLGGCQHVCRMVLDLHLAPQLRNLAVFADQIGLPVNAHIEFTIHRFFDPGAHLFGRVAGFVR